MGDLYKVAAYSLTFVPGQPGRPGSTGAASSGAKQSCLPLRKWLDWARDKVPMSGGDDPLAGHPFPYFWMKGQEGDATAIRIAALVLLPSEDLKGPFYRRPLDQALRRRRWTWTAATSSPWRWRMPMPPRNDGRKCCP